MKDKMDSSSFIVDFCLKFAYKNKFANKYITNTFVLRKKRFEKWSKKETRLIALGVGEKGKY